VSVEDALQEALSELRPVRNWASVNVRGESEAWQRTEDSWDLPAPPEDYALPPALPWTERLRELALRAYNDQFGRFLDAGQRYEIDWPPEGSLFSPGSWYADESSCSEHGDEFEDGCGECDVAGAEPVVVIDRPASWEWSVATRLVITEKGPDGSRQEYAEDEDRWLLGFTDADPRDVEYGAEKGTGERAELVSAFWKVERDKLATFRYISKSDMDGSRHLVVDSPALDLAGWRLEVHQDNRTYLCDFTPTRVWGTGGATNFLGQGESRTAWVADMDWGSEGAYLLLPDGSRHVLTAAVDAGEQLRDMATRQGSPPEAVQARVPTRSARRRPQEPWQDFDLVMQAAAYAAEAHRNDLRKATAIPYLSHLWSVAALVMEHGGDDEQVAAALLHDVAEDHGGAARLADVSARFGPEVARLVAALSDSLADTDAGETKPPWRERKQQYLAHLVDVDERVALISACDKLHNARAIEADLRTIGTAVWDRFTVTDPDDHLWYYTSLQNALEPKVPRALGDELRRTVSSIRTLARAGQA
jgi:hypothetical protein